MIKKVRPKSSEVMRLCGSNEKIIKLTDWKIKYSLEKGSKETIKWFFNPKNIQEDKVEQHVI